MRTRDRALPRPVVQRSARRRRATDDQGSAGLWTVWAVAVVLAVTLTALSWAAVVTARQRAESAADLAALAAARDLASGGDGCQAAARVAEATLSWVAGCESLADGSVIVTVQQPLTVSWLRGLDLPPVRAKARAGLAAG